MERWKTGGFGRNHEASLTAGGPGTPRRTAPTGSGLLHVDLEFETGSHDDGNTGPEGPVTHAAFLSPRHPHARLAGEPVERVAILAIAATRSYDRVHVVAADAGEADALRRLIAELTRADPVEIDVVEGEGR